MGIVDMHPVCSLTQLYLTSTLEASAAADEAGLPIHWNGIALGDVL